MESLRSLEHPHAPGSGRWWNESWYFDFASADGSVGGFVRTGLYPNQRCAWSWIYIVTERGTVSVRAHDVPQPKAPSMLMRSEGLWCELICETPMEHWSIGVEAFGVLLDDPTDSYTGEIGTRIPVGLDLEWVACAPPYTSAYSPEISHLHYHHAGTVRGEILLGTESIEIDGFGTRDHSYGNRDWWQIGWNWASACFGSSFALHLLQGGHNTCTSGNVWRGGVTLPVVSLDAAVTFDSDGLPLLATYVVNETLEVTAQPLYHAPVPLVDGTGRSSRLPRSLCRFTSDTAEVGYGWAEWLQIGEPALG